MKETIFSGTIVFLTIVSISIVWHFLTGNYPTHSDVFFMGMQAGVLVVVLLLCLSMIGLLAYRLFLISKKRT